VKGVETPPQAASLRGEGCDEAQRHLYAKPLVNSEFRKPRHFTRICLLVVLDVGFYRFAQFARFNHMALILGQSSNAIRLP
jgi:predicted signal transduction protein with EAL and GGDEF domain